MADSKVYYDDEGKDYTPKISGSFFGNNPNKDYAATGTVVGGQFNGYDVNTGGGYGGQKYQKLDVYMTANGKRGISANGLTYYETDPGSGIFKGPTHQDGYLKLDMTKPQQTQSPLAEPGGGEGGEGGGGGGGGGASIFGTNVPKEEVVIDVTSPESGYYKPGAQGAMLGWNPMVGPKNALVDPQNWLYQPGPLTIQTPGTYKVIV